VGGRSALSKMPPRGAHEESQTEAVGQIFLQVGAPLLISYYI
jgi:hypothetical protein